MTLLGGHHKGSEQQQEIREARRLLREKVKSSWEYPPLPAYRRPARRKQAEHGEDSEARVAGFRFHNPGNHGSVTLESEVTEWRERQYTSDSDSGGESVKASGGKGSPKSKTSEYRFEGPDSVGTQISERRTARKRKRRKDIEDEVSWNDGLKHWMSQRDAWSGARTPQQVHAIEIASQRDDEAVAGSAGSAASSESTPRTSTSSTTSASERLPSSAATTPDPVPTAVMQRPPTSTFEASVQADSLVPVCPAILPNHPIRRRMSPTMYTEIYNKIILQSRTPSVPINLLTLISALVQGWKDDGEWPPKSGPVEPSIGKRRGRGSNGSESGFKNGVKAVGRVLRLTGTSETSSQRAKEDG